MANAHYERALREHRSPAEAEAAARAAAEKVEAAILRKAATQTPDKLHKALRKAITRIDPTFVQEKTRNELKGRQVTHRTSRSGQTGDLYAHLGAAEAQGVYNVIDAYARAARQAGSSRNLHELRADVLTHLVIHGHMPDGSVPPYPAKISTEGASIIPDIDPNTGDIYPEDGPSVPFDPWDNSHHLYDPPYTDPTSHDHENHHHDAHGEPNKHERHDGPNDHDGTTGTSGTTGAPGTTGTTGPHEHDRHNDPHGHDRDNLDIAGPDDAPKPGAAADPKDPGTPSAGNSNADNPNGAGTPKESADGHAQDRTHIPVQQGNSPEQGGLTNRNSTADEPDAADEPSAGNGLGATDSRSAVESRDLGRSDDSADGRAPADANSPAPQINSPNQSSAIDQSSARDEACDSTGAATAHGSRNAPPNDADTSARAYTGSASRGHPATEPMTTDPTSGAGATDIASGSRTILDGKTDGVESPCAGGLFSRSELRAHVQITIGLETLLGLNEEPADLDGHGPITADTARDLAFSLGSTWRRLVTDPVTGYLLDYGRKTYRPPAALADHVRARDVICRTPTCDRPASKCALDHVISWPAGATSEPNLQCKCDRDHRFKHEGRWRHQISTDPTHPAGTIVMISPTGHVYLSYPHRYDPPPKSPPGKTNPPSQPGSHDQTRSTVSADPEQARIVEGPGEPPF